MRGEAEVLSERRRVVSCLIVHVRRCAYGRQPCLLDASILQTPTGALVACSRLRSKHAIQVLLKQPQHLRVLSKKEEMNKNPVSTMRYTHTHTHTHTPPSPPPPPPELETCDCDVWNVLHAHCPHLGIHVIWLRAPSAVPCTYLQLPAMRCNASPHHHIACELLHVVKFATQV